MINTTVFTLPPPLNAAGSPPTGPPGGPPRVTQPGGPVQAAFCLCTERPRGAAAPGLRAAFRSRPHDRGERAGVETRPADQRPVDLRLPDELVYVVGLDAAAVQDPQRVAGGGAAA